MSSKVIEVRPSMQGYEGVPSIGQTLVYWLPIRNCPDAHDLRPRVEALMVYAEGQPESEFHVKWDAFAQAGYTPREIGSLFSMVPPNVHLPCELQPFCKGIRGPYSMRAMGG
jgi:hypothetical protein